MPLTTTWTALLVSKCGWALSSLTRPCVAQRVWPMPVVAVRAATATAPSPSASLAATASNRFWRLPTARLARRAGSGEVAAAQGLERQQGAGDAVAAGHEVRVDDVAGLLAAQRPAAGAELLDHIAVADLRRGDLDAVLLHRRMEAVVR